MKLLSIKELCEYLHISKPTLWRYQKSGKIPEPKRLSPKKPLWEKSAVDEALGLEP